LNGRKFKRCMEWGPYFAKFIVKTIIIVARPSVRGSKMGAESEGLQIEVKVLERALPIPKECLESIRGVISGKKLARMRREVVDCPVKGKPVTFIECFSCERFIRRIRGKVTCASLGGEGRGYA